MINDNITSTPEPAPSSNKSFGEVLLAKMKKLTNKPAKAQRRRDLKSRVVTDDGCVKEIKEKEAGKQKKKIPTAANPRKKAIEAFKFVDIKDEEMAVKEEDESSDDGEDKC